MVNTIIFMQCESKKQKTGKVLMKQRKLDPFISSSTAHFREQAKLPALYSS